MSKPADPQAVFDAIKDSQEEMLSNAKNGS